MLAYPEAATRTRGNSHDPSSVYLSYQLSHSAHSHLSVSSPNFRFFQQSCRLIHIAPLQLAHHVTQQPDAIDLRLDDVAGL